MAFTEKVSDSRDWSILVFSLDFKSLIRPVFLGGTQVLAGEGGTP